MTHRTLNLLTGTAMTLFALTVPACSSDDDPQPEPNPQEKPNEEPGKEDGNEDGKEDDDTTPPADDLGWEDAQTAVKNMGVGWNLGNTLDAHDYNDNHDGADWRYWETYWGQPVTTPELMTMLKDAGFGAIRVPVTWANHMDESGNVNEAWMSRVQEVVNYVLDAGMYCILNVHHDTGADEKAWLVASTACYNKQQAKYENLWKQIAERFKDCDHKLLFEGYNEMLDEKRSWCFAGFNNYSDGFASDAYEAINLYAQSFVNTVRATGGNNVGRNLIVNTYAAACGGESWNVHLDDPLKKMELPKDIVENHIIFEVHAYPTIDDLNQMRGNVTQMMSSLKTHLASKGAPVIFGEWGHSSDNPAEDKRLEFLDYFVQTAKSEGFGTFHWMGMTDALARSVPAFSEPKAAEAILKAFHGSSFSPTLPIFSADAFNYAVTYSSQWGEANICDMTIASADYKSVRLTLEEAASAGELNIKFYGDIDGKAKETSKSVNGKEIEVTVDATAGTKITRITLQSNKANKNVTITKAALVKRDGTEELRSISSFWGCNVEIIKK